MTRPAPTVRPPSRIANRRPSSIAIGLNQLDAHVRVVTRHNHVLALGQVHDTGDVGRPEVELRTVVVEERRVPATLILRKDVGLRLELRVRGDRTGLAADLTALNVLALGATQQQADVVARLALVEQLAEHLDAGDIVFCVAWRMPTISISSFTLTMPRSIRPVTTVPRPVIVEDVLDRHQERLVDLALGRGMYSSTAPMSSMIDSAHFSSPWSAGKAATRITGTVVAGEFVAAEQLANLHLDELDELLVVHHVALVQATTMAGTPT